MITKYLLLSILTIIGLPGLANACGCLYRCLPGKNQAACVAQRKQDSAAVFSGVATAIEETRESGVYKAQFSVSDAWKGVRTQTIDVYYDHMGGTSCAFSMAKGQKETYFAWKSKGRIFVGPCSGGTGLESHLGKTLRLLPSPSSQ
jgi:hypothetical protein